MATCSTSPCDPATSPYGYQPNLAANAVFLGVSTVCLVGCLAATVRTRRHAALGAGLSLACVLLVIAYTDRLAGWRDPWSFYPFAQGTVLATVAPLFITSSIYTSLDDVVRLLGEEHSPIPPRLYVPVLLSLEVLSFILHIAGFSVVFSSPASSLNSIVLNHPGLWAVVAGLAIQLTTLLLTIFLLGIILVRAAVAYRQYGYTTFHRDLGYVPLPSGVPLFLGAVSTGMLCLLVRLGYRLAAFSSPGGLGSSVATSEGLFVGLEGFLTTYVLVVLAVCYPGLCLEDGRPRRRESFPEDGVPFVEHEATLEAASKVYIEQEKRLARNASKVSRFR